MAETAARRDWMKANTTIITMRLNHNTDKDILVHLEGKSKQTEIKRLLRLALEMESKN